MLDVVCLILIFFTLDVHCILSTHIDACCVWHGAVTSIYWVPLPIANTDYGAVRPPASLPGHGPAGTRICSKFAWNLHCRRNFHAILRGYCTCCGVADDPQLCLMSPPAHPPWVVGVCSTPTRTPKQWQMTWAAIPVKCGTGAEFMLQVWFSEGNVTPSHWIWLRLLMYNTLRKWIF